MTHSRSVFSKITIKVLSLLLRPGKFKRFRPDLTVDDGYDLSEYGLDGDLFGGDLEGYQKLSSASFRGSQSNC